MRPLLPLLPLLLPLILLLGADSAQAAPTRTNSGLLVAFAPNGQEFILKEDHSAPLALVNTWFRVGSRNEDPAHEGISHFLEHMLFDGTTVRNKDAYDQLIFKHALQDNASTSYDNTNYYIQGPVESFRTMITLHAEMLMGPALADSEFGREREVVKEELRRAQDNPGSWLFRQTMLTAFPHLHYNHQVLGTIAKLDAESNQQMRDYFAAHYGPNNAITIAIGDFRAEDALKQLMEVFRTWPRRSIPPDFPAGKDTQNAPRSIAMEGAFESTSQMLVFKSPQLVDPSTYASDLLMQILAGGQSSRLTRRLRDELKLVSDISGTNFSLEDASALDVSWDLIDPAKATDAANAVLEVLAQMRREGPTAEELALAKRQLARQRILENETLLGQARSIGYYTATAADVGAYETYLDHIFGITQQDVQFCAQKYFASTNATLAVIGQTGTQAVNPTWATLDAPVTPLVEPRDLGRVGTNPFAQLAGGAIASASAAETYTLENGLTVYLRPSTANSTVGVSLSFRGGLAWEDWGTNGLGNLTMSSLAEGTWSRTKEQIAKLEDEISEGVASTASNDSLSISSLFLSSDIDQGLDLIADLAIHPSFPAAGIELVRGQQLQAIRAAQDDMMQATRYQLLHALYGESCPYGRQEIGRPSVVSSLTRDQVVAFHARVMHPSNAVLAVVGSFQPDEMKALISKEFGGWSAEPTAAEVTPGMLSQPAPLSPEGSVRIVQVKQKAQSVIWIGLPGVGYNDADLAPLRVMNTILGSSSQARLFTRLRGKEGLAYGTYSGLLAGQGTGLFLANIATRPEMYEQAVAGLNREITLMKTDGATDTEVADAITYLVGQEAQRHQGHLALATFASSNLARGLPVDYEWQILKSEQATTPAMVNAAAAKYLDLSNHYLAVSGPIYAPPANLE